MHAQTGYGQQRREQKSQLSLAVSAAERGVRGVYGIRSIRSREPTYWDAVSMTGDICSSDALLMVRLRQGPLHRRGGIVTQLAFVAEFILRTLKNLQVGLHCWRYRCQVAKKFVGTLKKLFEGVVFNHPAVSRGTTQRAEDQDISKLSK